MKINFCQQVGFASSYNFNLQIASGLNFLHDRKTPIIHNNLAARNCYLIYEKDAESNERQSIVRIADFWPFKLNVYNPQHPDKCRNYRYLLSCYLLGFRWFAPETIKEGLFDVKTDVWSYGVTVWEIFNDGMKPYGNVDVVGRFC